MRLRNPGTIDHAIQTIRNLQNYLGNSRGQHDAEGRKDAFLNWCEDQARPNLESLLDPGEEILGELESAYNRLALAPQMTLRRLNGLLNREYTIWDQRLRRAEEELQAQKKLAGRPGRPVVLDTSVLMEGEPFLTFGWRALAPALAGEPVRLIVPILVIEELDDLLHDRDGARRQKARAATRELWQLHGARPTDPAPLPGQADVTIEVLLDGDWHQRRPNNDTEIIDQALQVHELTGKATILTSCDYRQLYRAAAAGIPAVLMPRRNQDGTGPTTRLAGKMASMSDRGDGWGDAEFAALGRITVNFAELDRQAGLLLAGFIRPRDVAVIVTAGAELRWTLEKLAVIATEALEDPQASQALLDWVKASLALADRRNQLIHSHYLPQAGEQSLTRMKATTRGDKWKGQSEPVSLADLSETADLLAEGLAAAGLLAEGLGTLPGMGGPSRPVGLEPAVARVPVCAGPSRESGCDRSCTSPALPTFPEPWPWLSGAHAVAAGDHDRGDLPGVGAMPKRSRPRAERGIGTTRSAPIRPPVGLVRDTLPAPPVAISPIPRFPRRGPSSSSAG